WTPADGSTTPPSRHTPPPSTNEPTSHCLPRLASINRRQPVKFFPLILLAGCILIETGEQMLYRMGGRQPNRYFAFVIPAVMLNLVSLALWLVVLRYMPLGQALPLLAANNVTVAVAGRALFGEIINRRRRIGILLIVCGFVLVSVNQS